MEIKEIILRLMVLVEMVVAQVKMVGPVAAAVEVPLVGLQIMEIELLYLPEAAVVVGDPIIEEEIVDIIEILV